jgi:hypothetical protein
VVAVGLLDRAAHSVSWSETARSGLILVSRTVLPEAGGGGDGVGDADAVHVGIRPRIDYIKLDEHTRTKFIAKGTYRGLYSFLYFLLFSTHNTTSVLQAAANLMYIYTSSPNLINRPVHDFLN